MGMIDKFLTRFGYNKAEKKTAGFFEIEQAQYPTKRVETEKIYDYRDFIDAYKKLPWVYAGATALAVAATKPILRMYSGDPNGDKTEKELPEVLSRPNPFLSQSELIETTVINLAICGEHYWNLVGTVENGVIGKLNPPVEIWWMKPEQVEIVPDPKKFISRYVFSCMGKDIPLDPSEVIHFKRPNVDSYYRGLGAMEPGKNTAILEFNAIAYNQALLANDGTPAGLFHFEDKPTKEQIEAHRRMWSQTHGGAKKAGKMGYTYGGVEYKELGKTPKDIQYGELRKMDREEQLATLGVPPSVVGLLEYANYSNMEVQQKKFWQDAVIPVLTIIESMLTLKLGPMFGDKVFFKYDYSGIKVLQEDEKMLADTAAILVNAGILTRNEARERYYNLEAVEGGDTLLVPISLVPLSSAVEPKEPEPVPEPEPEEEEPQDDDEEEDEAKKAKRLLLSKIWQSETKRKVLWDAFVKRVNTQEAPLEKLAKKYLKEQGEKIKAALAGQTDINFAVNNVFDEEAEIKRYLKETKAWYIATAEEGGEAGLRATEGKIYLPDMKRRADEIPFELRPELLEILEGMIIESGTKICETTMKKIVAMMQKAVEESWTVEELTQNIYAKLADLSVSRSRRIARTESCKVDNWGQLEGYKEAEFVDLKAWLSAFAPETRESHKAADTSYADNPIPLNDPFIVDGETLQFPGDPAGSAENVINCLCSMVPMVSEG